MMETSETTKTIRSQTVSRVLALDESTRQVKHIISTAALDRSNRIVDVSGWKLANYRSNPVVLADHDYSIDKIIGKARETKIEQGLVPALVSTTEFDSEGLGNVAFRLVQAGLANSWSVGWMGLKSHELGTGEECPECQSAEVQKLMKSKKYFYGTHYTAQDLLEYSLVAIPSNPEAVMGLRTAGLVATDEADAWIKALSHDDAHAPNVHCQICEDRKPAENPPTLSAKALDALYSLTRHVALRNGALQTAERIGRRTP